MVAILFLDVLMIMQLILIPMFYDMVEEVDFEDLYSEDSTRGSGGFGSTGV